MASTACSAVEKAVTMMTAVSGERFFTWASKASPSMPGIFTSEITRS